jgi:hypothetical protein
LRSTATSLDRIEEGPPISTAAAYAIVAAVPVLGMFSFFWQNVSEAALIALVATSGFLLWRDRAQGLSLPIAMGLVWMAFVALSAVWATYSGSPGNQFRSLPKHIPIALGPLIAIAFAAACRRLHWSTDRLLALFLTGLIGGALVLLIRNGAIDVIVELRHEGGMLGNINRNLAALACSVAIAASVGLLDYWLFRLNTRSFSRWGVVFGLIVILVGLLVLLALLQSRGGYIGSSAGLVTFAIALAVFAWRFQKSNVGRQLRFAALLLAGVALTFTVYNIVKISGSAVAMVPAGERAHAALQLLYGSGGRTGAAIALIAVVIVLAAPARRQHSKARSRIQRVAAVFLAIFALLLVDHSVLAVSGRTLVEAHAVGGGTTAELHQLFDYVLHGQFDQAYAIARNGEERIQLLTLAADLIHRRPWLGWGPDVWLLAQHYSPIENIKVHNQFHNGYAQFLVSFGIVGVVVFAAYLATLVRAALPRQRAPAMSASMFAAAIALLVTLLVINISESVLMVNCAAYSAMMIAAIACLRSNRGETSPRSGIAAASEPPV